MPSDGEIPDGGPVVSSDSPGHANIAAKFESMNVDDQRMPQNIYCLPIEILIEIFENLEMKDRWSLARSSRTLYRVGRTHSLFKYVDLGFSGASCLEEGNSGYDRLKKKWPHISDTTTKLWSDLQFIQRSGIGDLVREATIGLHPMHVPQHLSQGVDIDITTPLIAVLTSIPNLVQVILSGHNQIQTFAKALATLSTYCNKLSTICIYWTFRFSPTKEEAYKPISFPRPLVFPALKVLAAYIYDSTIAHPRKEGEGIKEKNSPIQITLEAFLGPCGASLRELDLAVKTRYNNNIIDWSKFSEQALCLKVFKYRHWVLEGPVTRDTVDIDAICNTLKNTERVYLWQGSRYGIAMPETVLHDLHAALSRLAKCTFVHIGLNLPTDYSSYELYDEPHELSEKDLVRQAFAERRNIMVQITKTMPVLKRLDWPYHNGSYDRNLQMSVERDSMGKPIRLKFTADYTPGPSRESLVETTEVSMSNER